MADESNKPDPTSITGIAFVTSYVDDYKRAFEFYSEVLRLEKSFDVDRDACFFKVGNNQYGLLLQGGVEGRKTRGDATRSSFVLMVDSASMMYQKLSLNGVRLLQEEPIDMGEGDFWFQFHDPAGNILEILGGK
jgi:predicted enzyme related to lactoylglutathione lyase